ncbi:MAG: hypothetical protein B6245_11335 [Desulfobacteraceae bacterium 4572_88]|nr:MAG: hypothetical protein B6245_11335 [Desulfobacteraceae bacterium 4572_88]
MAENNNLRFKYVFPEDYCPAYVNTVHGGITARGELEIHFLHDRPPLPDTSEMTFIEGHPIQREFVADNVTGLRHVKTGVIMDYDSARRLHKWLTEKIGIFDSMMEKARAQQADRDSASEEEAKKE